MGVDTAPEPGRRQWASRLGWLVLIWVCSVAALGFTAWLMKVLMRAGGLG
jgi:hypothetical protein